MNKYGFQTQLRNCPCEACINVKKKRCYRVKTKFDMHVSHSVLGFSLGNYNVIKGVDGLIKITAFI